MQEFCFGLYATRIYLPLSSISRRWRRLGRRLRGRGDRFLQQTRLPEQPWSRLGAPCVPRVWEHKKRNGNVRVSEVGILAALATACSDGTNLFEIGTFDGRTTLNLAMNAPAGCRIHTLDLPPDHPTKFDIAEGERHMVEKPVPGARLERYRRSHPRVIDRIRQHLGDSATFDYTPFHDSCSLVFVDGSHAYDYAISDTRAAMEMVRPGGVVLWHDYGIWEGVTRALEELEQRTRLGLRSIAGTSLVYWRRP